MDIQYRKIIHGAGKDSTMKLVRVANKIHKASQRGVTVSIGKVSENIPTAACNPKKWNYALGGNHYAFEGEPNQITCQKCLAKIS